MRRALLALLLALSALPARGEVLRVSAASSLTEAFSELARRFELAHPGDRVELNLAGSQILRTQIEQGAPVDVFASADLVQMEPLARAGRVEPPRVFAGNRLVVVASRRSGVVKALPDLGKPFVKVVLAAPTVPAGRYALTLLQGLEPVPGFGPGFAGRVRVNVVSEETSVRSVLAKVALGEADAGVVYATDAASSGAVEVIEVPPAARVEARYPIAVVAPGPRAALARAFVALVLSSEGQDVLKARGFTGAREAQ